MNQQEDQSNNIKLANQGRIGRYKEASDYVYSYNLRKALEGLRELKEFAEREEKCFVYQDFPKNKQIQQIKDAINLTSVLVAFWLRSKEQRQQQQQ